MELEEYIMEELLKGIIVTEEDGSKFVKEDDLDKLTLTVNEYNFVKNIMKKNKINLYTKTEKDRTTKVKDIDYGEVEVLDFKSIDKPKMSELEYNEEELVFSDFDELDKFLDNVFIPENYNMIKAHSKDGNAYPAIKINKLLGLRLSEAELAHAIGYLAESGITVKGTLQDMEEFDNSDYIKNYYYTFMGKPLSWNEQKKLFEEYNKTKDPVIKEKLILANLKLVPFVAYQQHLKTGYPQEDLESAGYELLIKLIDDYDMSNEKRFSSYAVQSLRVTMSREANNTILGIRFPQHQINYLNKAIRTVESEKNKKLSYNDQEMLEDMVDVYEKNQKLKRPLDEESRKNIKQYILDIKFPEKQQLEYDYAHEDEYIKSQSNPEEEFIKKSLRNELEENLDALTEREKEIIMLKYGFDGGYGKTYEEIGKKYNVTRDRVRQWEAKALRKLRHPSRSEGLKDYLDDYDSTSDVMYEKIDKTDKNTYYEQDVEILMQENDGIQENSSINRKK